MDQFINCYGVRLEVNGYPLHLKIKYKETTYETVDFDHGFPPLEIEKLVHKIVALAKANE